MLSEEEIEKAKRYFEDELHSEKITYNCVNHYRQTIIDNHIVLYKYIKQLESDNYEANNIINEYIEERQKLIEKLERDIENANDNIKHMEEKSILQTIARELAIGMRDYAQEILEMLGGNK